MQGLDFSCSDTGSVLCFAVSHGYLARFSISFMCLLFKLASDATESWKAELLWVPQSLKDGMIVPDLNNATYCMSKLFCEHSLILTQPAAEGLESISKR